MKLQEVKTEVAKYQYLEDTRFIDASLACIIASRLKLGRPLWLIIIGPSSAGKTQLLRPLAMTDPKYIHSIDDLTENTFLSGFMPGKKTAKSTSLLHKIGKQGMIVISDLTGIFSKSAESKVNILGQFRMIYDGEMVKYVGTSPEPISWKGEISILAGATPSIYRHFQEVSSFGERFIHYRMKDFDRRKATRMMLDRKNDSTINETMAVSYETYIKEVVTNSDGKEIILSEQMLESILEVSDTAEKMRVGGEFDWKTEYLVHNPVPAMPMRTVGQLMSLAKGLKHMSIHDGEDRDKDDIKTVEWCAYSLVNEERRTALRVLARMPYRSSLSSSKIGDESGLSTPVVRMNMQILASVGIIRRIGQDQNLTWSIDEESVWNMVRRIEGIETLEMIKDRAISAEETEELKKLVELDFQNLDS